MTMRTDGGAATIPPSRPRAGRRNADLPDRELWTAVPADLARLLRRQAQTLESSAGGRWSALGEQLSDPDIRFELEIVLRACQAVGVTTGLATWGTSSG